MGKVIVGNIKGMSWKARTTLIIALTVLATFAMYGWFGARRTEAAISQLVAWTNVYHSATAMNGAGSSFAVAAGKNRMLVVGVSVSLTGGTAQTTGTVTYGGTAMTLALGDAASTARAHTYLYYLPLGDATVADASKALAVTITGGTSRVNDIYYAVYTGVDQSAPITNSRNYNSGTGTVASGGTFAFATALTINANNQAILVYAQDNTASTTAPTLTLATGFTQGATNTWTTTSGAKATTAYQTTKPTTNTTSTCTSTNGTVASYVSMTGISLKPATTTLGNGVAGTGGNTAPGALRQKVDGFSFATSATGTTDSITGLTVTTTNYTAIDSMEIWDEAQTTQYFATVINPGTNTWTFSSAGGTPIPVSGATAANYKILVNFKTRANGAPAGNTGVTANVTGFTSGNGNITAGTDAVDPSVTLVNTHNAPTWGTNTAGDAQITLNWNSNNTGQKVVIIRYNTNTDTTKPADGTTWKTGDTFGVGGTVRFVGTTGSETTTIDNVNVQNRATYYYKIFVFDTYNNYTATDVWTGPLNPISSDSTPPTVSAGFAATTPVNTTSIPITSFVATDNVGGKGVAGYLITTSSTPPAFNDPGWSATPLTSFTVAGQGSYTLYPWALDGGGNVSAVYGAPVTVLVDQTAPTIVSFSAPAQVANNRIIPISAFSATDAGGANGVQYLITTTNAQPSAGAAGWSSTAPTTYGVGADGSYTLYPWAKDAAGNVTAAYGSPVSVQVDFTGPTVPAPVSPADMATDQLLSTQLSVNPSTDAGVGGVQYWFEVTNADIGYSVNSGWTGSTSFSPGGLTSGQTYTWKVQAKDALGNPSSSFSTPRTFTTAAACVRNAPTITLLTGTGSIAQTITTDGGTANYNLSITNNDYGGCGTTPFTFTVTDNDVENKFDPAAVTPGAVTLAPGQATVATVAVKATPGIIGGVDRTHVTSTDPYHSTITTGDVITTINVSGCHPHTPLLTIGPNTGYAARGGVHAYTVTVKNTDTGASCAPATFNLSIPGESNSTDYNTSTLSSGSLTLDAGEAASVTLNVSAKATAAQRAVNVTQVAVVAAGHAAPPNNSATTTVNNPLLHNSDITGSSKWAGSGGWGLPGTKYGEFQCVTCHVQGGTTTANIKRVRESIVTPDPSKGTIPGDGKPVVFNRTVGTKASGVLAWDAGATPRTSSTNICQVCHTYDATGANGTKVRPYATTATLGSHYQTDGKDCIRCHKHSVGFGLSGLNCTFCHGTPTTGTIDGTNRYVVAPPMSVAGNTGLVTGVGQVSNDPKVGAHQTHLRTLNGFTNYSTVDFRCTNCHGPIPTDYSHGNVAGSASPVFQGQAIKGGMTPSFNSANRTCSNTYCHNPAASGVLLASNAGSNVFPSWTSARYVSSGTKSVANCSVCHKVPGVVGFEPAGTHSGMSADTTDCSGCHGHNGDASGTLGKRHMDGIKFGAGNCDTCHGYDVGTWAAKAERSGVPEGKGAHEKHIAYLKARYTVTLLPGSDSFGSGNSWTYVCGTCHNGATHTMGEAIPGTGRTISIIPARQFGSSAPIYNGTVGVSSSVKAKTCSNVDCHYKETPIWSTY